ncbi:RNA-directed DNA polymerase, eukaryota [Tanacetum coccineum]
MLIRGLVKKDMNDVILILDRFDGLWACGYGELQYDFKNEVLLGQKRRKLRGGYEQVQFDMVEDLVKTISLTPIYDRWNWELESSGDFSVASVQNLIDSRILPNLEYKTRWINYVPIKVNVHAWKIMTDSLPTRFNISRRGICIDSILCANCDTGVETVSHLFFLCGMARDVVNLITRWWNFPSKNKKMLEEQEDA